MRQDQCQSYGRWNPAETQSWFGEGKSQDHAALYRFLPGTGADIPNTAEDRERRAVGLYRLEDRSRVAGACGRLLRSERCRSRGCL